MQLTNRLSEFGELSFGAAVDFGTPRSSIPQSGTDRSGAMDSRYGWVIVAAGALITCVAMGAMFALPVYLQPMSDDTGWGHAGISLAMTFAFIVMGVAGFGWGAVTDRIGPRPVVLIGSVMLGVGLFVASRAPNLLVFQIAYGGLCGASVGAFFAPIMATTLAWFDKHRSL